MNRSLRVISTWVLVAAFVIPAQRAVYGREQAQAPAGAAIDPIAADSTATTPSSSVAQFKASVNEAARAVARASNAPSSRMRGTAGSQTGSSQSNRRILGSVLFGAGLALTIGALAGPGREYGRLGCSDASVYDAPECQRLRSNTLGLGISGIIAGAIGLGLLFSSKDKRPSTPGAAYAPSTIPPPAVDQSALANARTAIDQINSESPGQLPTPQRVGNCSGTVTHILLTNNTVYVLTVFVAGAEGRTVSVAAGQSIQFQLVPGRYSVGARVNAANVRPFAGIWDLGAGCSFKSTFYIGSVQS